MEAPASADEPGELVCAKPFPSMPVYFWNDPDYKLYRAAYFDKLPGNEVIVQLGAYVYFVIKLLEST